MANYIFLPPFDYLPHEPDEQYRIRNIPVFSQFWAFNYVAFMSIKPYEMMPLQRFRKGITDIVKYSFTQGVSVKPYERSLYFLLKKALRT